MIKQLLGSLAVRPNDSNEIVENQCFNKVATYSGIKNKALFFSFTFIFSFFGFGQSITLTNSTLSAFESCTGVVSSEQDFSISGESLTADIEIAALSGYEYSTDNTTYTATLSLPFGGGTVSATTIYVRLTSTASGTPGGNIVCSSTGATDQNVAVSGEVLSNPLTQVVLAVDDRPCGNTATGSATISLTGGDAPYSYSWTLDGSAFTASPAAAPTNLSAGTYVVTVTDACNNQVASNSITVSGAPTLALNSSVTPAQNATIACNGDQTASITAEIQGGTAPRTLTVTNTVTGTSYSSSVPTGPPSLGSFPYEVTGLPAGTYTVTASDGTSSCEDTYSSVVISEPALYTVSVSAVDATVCTGLNGQFTLTGTAGHVVTYNINGGANTTATIGGGGSVVVTLTGITVDQTLTLVSVTDATSACSNTLNGTATITVNPLPNVSAGADQTVCSGVDVTLAGTGATSYSWDNGITNNVAFTTSNTTIAAVSITYTVTGTDANSCENTDAVVVIVDPTPVVVAQTAAVCTGVAFTVAPTNGSGNIVPSNTTYSWAAPSAVTGISGLASGTDASNISGTLSNSTNAPIDVVYSVTPTSGSCDGTAFNVTVTVNPTPVVVAQTAAVCTGVAFTVAPTNGSGNIVPSNTTYSWAAPAAVTGISGLASGTDASNISGTLSNSTNAPIDVVYSVTPTSGSCDGTAFNVTVTVNPTPVVVAQTAAVCTGVAFTVAPTNGSGNIVPSNTTYSWAAPAAVTGISGLASGTDASNISGTLSNSTSAPIDVVYSVTPTSGSCDGTAFNVTVTVNPTPVVSDQTVTSCSGSAFTVGPVDGNNSDVVPSNTTYSWAAPAAVTGISGLASGTDASNISGTLSNSTNAPIDVVYSVTPTSGSCDGTAFNVTVTVNPTPVVVAQTAAVCTGVAFTVAPTNGSGNIVPSNTTYSWAAPAAVTGISGLASGTDASNISGTLSNSTNAPIDVVYSVTPTSGSCDGTAFNVTVTVNPTPVVVAQTAAVCTGVAFTVAPTNGSGNIVPSNTTYSWAAPAAVTGISGLASGTDASNISGTLSNSTSAPIDVVYSVTPTSGSCDGTAFNVTVTVNPTPVVSDQTVTSCSGSAFTVGPVDGNNSDVVPSNTTYSWAAPAAVTGISGLASGTDASNISGTLSNSTNADIDVTYTVTPTSGSCQGATFTVTVTVEPTPSVVAQTAAVCTGVAFTVAPTNGSGNIVPSNTTYSWAAPAAVTGISGLASGTDASNISGTLSNSTSAPIDVVYSVTPTSGSCDGTAFNVTVTVNPTPVVSDQTVTSCSGSAFTVGPVDGNNSDVVPSNTTYSWAAPAAVTGISGLASGTDASNISGTLSNSTNADIDVTYTVTPTSGSCQGATFTVTVTVEPTPSVVAQTAAVCTGVAFTVAPTNGSGNIVPSNTTYSWAAPAAVTGISGLASGTDASNISGTLSNSTNAPIDVVYSVTPTSGSCDGTAFNVTVTVNPTPVVVAQTAAVCTGVAFTVAPTNGSGNIVPSNTTYSWAAPAAVTGISGLASGTDASNISGTLSNSTSAPIDVVYSVTPTSGSCDGTAFNVTVTVNPTPVVSDQTVTSCSGSAFTVGPVDGNNSDVVPSNTTYSWAAPAAVTGISGLASGTDASNISGTLSNSTNADIDVTYTVTPTSGSCQGATFTVTVTVEPTPSVVAQTAAVCTGVAFTVAPTNGSGNIVPSNTTYSWAAPAAVTGISGLASGTDASNISGTLSNSTSAPIDVVYSVTPTSGSCDGTAFNVTVTVNPTPVVVAQTAAVCTGVAFTVAPTNGSGNIVPSNTTYSWAAPAAVTGISGLASGTDASNISGTLSNSTNAPIDVVYSVTPTSGSCDGTAFNVTVTVNPTPVVVAQTAAVCTGVAFTVAPTNGSGNIVPSNTTYSWAAPAAVTGISGLASGTDASNISGTLSNSTNAPIDIVYSVTPTSGSCDGTAFNVTVTVNPTPTVNTVSNQLHCVGDASDAVAFASTFGVSGTTYSWTNNNTATGLAGSGTGDIASFTTENLTNASLVSQIEVTPIANSCSGAPMTFTITVNPTINITNDPISNASCFNTSDGNIPVNVTGGTTPYSYAWSGPNGFTATTEDLVFNAAPGTYSVTVTDDVGCTETLSNLVVGSPSAVTFSFNSTNVDCNGALTGAIDLTASGGSLPYDYSWTQDGTAYSTQEDLTNIPAGDYAVTVTDGNFCVFTSNTVTIDEPALYTASVSAVNAAVCSGLNGQFTLSGTAGHVVTYSINGGANTTATIGGGGSVVVTLTGITVDQTLTLVSVTDATSTCSNTVTGSSTITINALPTVSAGIDQTVCNGVDVTLAGSGATSYSWDNGITNNVAFTTSNTTNTAVSTTYTVTGTDANGCENTDAVNVIVNPTPTVDAVTSQELCNNATTSVTFASTFNVSGTTYSWVNDNTAIGLAASGTGNIASFAVSNSGTTDIIATITVTPSANGCDGTAETFTITVKPTPTVDQQADITYCGGVAQSPIVFTGSTSNTVYDWTSSQNVGFFSSGTANPQIGGYVIDPAAQVVSNVSVTPQITAGGTTCSGTIMTFSVTVNPTPSISDVTETICSAGSFTVTPSNGGSEVVPANTTYSWSAPTVSGITGLASGSSATSVAGTLTNTTNAAIDVTYTVTPTSGQNCAGSPFQVTVTVEPTPLVVAQTTAVCTDVAFSVTPTNGSGNIVPANTTYSWSAPSAIAGISGLASGTDLSNISGTLTNSTSAPITVTYVVTPSYDASPSIGSSYGGGILAYILQSGDPGYSASNGTGLIVASQNAGQASWYIDNVNVSSTSSAAIGSGLSNTLSIISTLQGLGADPSLYAAGIANNYNGGGFNDWFLPSLDEWEKIFLNVGPAAAAPNTDIADIPANGYWSSTRFNLIRSHTPYSGNLTDYSGNGWTGGGVRAARFQNFSSSACQGSSFTVSVTVNPTPVVSDQTATSCSGTAFIVAPVDGNNSDVVPSNTTYSWAAPAAVTGITGLASGTNEANFSGNLTNTTNTAIAVTYTVTPTSGTCQGATFDVVVTVDPTPSVAAQTTAVCTGVAFSVAPANGSGNIVPTGTTYDWSAPSAITGISGLSAAGTPQTTIGGTLLNSTNAPIDVIYSVTPTSGSCDGAAFNVTVTVNPTPVVADQTVTSCSGSAFTASPTNGSGNIVPSNTTYSWAAPSAVTGITGLASGTTEANFNGNLTNTTNAAIVVTYTVTPTSGTCQGATFDVVVTVDPTPSIADESTAICSGDAFSVVPSSSSASNASDLFISEYVEGSSLNKYIEIFNGTGGSVDLSDYRLRLYANGASTPNNDVILSGTLANNGTIVYSNSSATAYTGSSTTNAAVGFNGDDAVALYKISSSSFVDVFGRIGDDPGSAWSAGGNSTLNKTLVRNSNITGGVTASPTGTGPTAFTTLASEWSQSNQDDVSNLGTHTYGTSNSNIIPTAITYSWPAPAAISGISGLASGTNETTIGGALTNSTNAAIQVTYVVTPTSGSCQGATFNVVVTVNPVPSVVAQTTAVCTAVAFSVAPANGSGNNVPTGTTYDWSAPSAITGISGLSSGTAQTTIGGTLLNSTSAPIDVVYSVTPTSGSCVGAAFNVTVTVNPTPVVSDQTVSICSSSAFTLAPVDGDNSDVVPSTTTYSWAAPSAVVGITGLASGTNEANFNGTLSNTTTSAISVTYAVTPTDGSCQGSPFNVVVTVNPTPVVAAKTATVCSADAFSVVPVDGVSGDIVPAGTTYDWSAPSAISGITGLSAGTAQSTIGGTLTNTTNAPITVIYSVTPSISNCSGTAFDVSVTVNPVPDIADATLSSCSESVFSFTPSGTSDIIPSGTTYTWTFADNPFVVGEANQPTAQTSLDQTLLNLSSTAQTVVYTVTPTSGTCVGNTFTLSATINPLPVVAAITGASNVCEGLSTTLASSTTGGVWSTSDATVADVSASGVVTGVSAGSATISYSVTANGCTTTTSASMTVNAAPTAAVTASGATTFCAGGSVDLTANAGTSYLWSNGAQTQTITVTTSGSYSVTVTNGSGCSTTSAAEAVTVNPLPTVAAITGSPDVCVGSTTVLASSTTGGVWSTSDATVADVSASGVVTGASVGSATITYTVTDGNGCTNSTSASVTVNATPTATVTASGATTFCAGGTVDLTANAGTSYLWSNGSQTQTITVTTSGSYSVTVTNGSGCSTTSAAEAVTVNPLPTVAAITGSPDVCVGSTTVLASSTTGGVWSTSDATVADVSASGVVTGASVGSATITYTVTDGNGCTNSTSASVTVNASPTATVTASGATTFCAGGTVDLTANAGTSYLWSNGAQTQTITVTTSGSYSVTVTNGSGCSTTSSAEAVTVNPLPTVAAITGSPDVCVGSTTVLASSTTGGVWSTSDATVADVSASGVVTGASVGSATITYTVTDGNGCTNSTSASVTVNATPTATVTASGATTFCAGGTVDLTANAGTSYLWSNGSQTQTITVTTSGSYSVTVTNGSGCSTTSAAEAVTVNPLPTVAAITGSPDVCVGSTTVLASSTTGGVWSTSDATVADVSASGVVTGASAGSATITYTITDGNGCTNSTSASVTVNASPTATVTASGATTFCAGGTVDLTANAGTSYLWSNGSQTQTITVTTSGSYSVTVTNGSGCSTTSSAQSVTVNPLPTVAAITGSPDVCVGSTTVLASSTAGGVWSTSDATVADVSASGVVTGASVGSATITYTVTDGNGCTNSTSASVTVNATPTATVTASGATTFCAGGTVDLTANAGTSYLWSNGSQTQTITVTTSGSYSVTVTNGSGCSTTSAAEAVTVNPLPTVAAITGSPDVCVGSTTVLASSTTGGVWSTSDATVADVSASGVVTGASVGSATITYTVTDGNGCTNSTSASVTVNASPTATVTASGATTFCAGGTVDLTANAGTSYLWSNGSQTQTITVTTSGSYSVTVTNGSGCSTTSAAEAVTVNPLPTVAAITGSPDVCVGSTTVLASSTTGGVWSTSDATVADVSASGVVTGASVGSATITYTVTDGNGCTNSTSASVTVNATPTATVTASGATTFCAGGTVDLTANAGTSYLWSNGSQTQTITVTTSGSYSVTVTNGSGCSTTSSAEAVTVNPLPTVAAITGSPDVCVGSTTVLASSTTGGVWSTSDATVADVSASGVVTGASAGSATITYTITDGNGCTNSTSASVTVNASPTATVTASGATTFCAGGTVDLTANAGTSYLWSNGAQTQTITVTTSGSYSVTVTNGSGCSTTSSAQSVTVNPLPTVAAITGSPDVCVGSTTVLASSTAGGVWSTSDATVADVSASGVVTGASAGSATITYTVTDGNGCTNSTSASVSVDSTPAVPIIVTNGPTTICPQSSVTLTAPAGYTYVWSTGDQTASISVNQTDSYTVTVSNAAGCSTTSAPIDVTVEDVTAPTLVVPNDVIVSVNNGCEATVDIGNALAVDNCTLLSLTNDAPTFYPIGTTIVTWTATDASGNVTTLTQEINVVDDINPTITAPGAVVAYTDANCEATGVDLGTAAASDNCNTGLVVSNDAPVAYPIGLTVVTWTAIDAYGNTSSATQDVNVFDTVAPVIDLVDIDFTLDALGEGDIVFDDIDNGTTDNCGIATITLSQTDFNCDNVGNNVVTVTVTDNSGNVSTEEVNVFVNASAFCGDASWDGPAVPEAFTPNDNGINDYFVVPGLDGYNVRELTVFDRYGGVVYESNLYNNDWDGTNMSGDRLPDATYYYILTITGGKTKAGYVYINRVK